MFPRVLVDSEVLKELDREAALLHTEMEYRPVVVLMVTRPDGRLLFLHSAKGPYWGFPQGGVDKGESITAAILRELFEETGIPSEDVVITKFCHLDRIDILQRKREGFSKGKRYYYFSVERERGEDVVLQLDEADDYRWVLPSEVPDLIREVSEEKRNSMLIALSKL